MLYRELSSSGHARQSTVHKRQRSALSQRIEVELIKRLSTMHIAKVRTHCIVVALKLVDSAARTGSTALTTTTCCTALGTGCVSC
jgi:hypothetical protein